MSVPTIGILGGIGSGKSSVIRQVTGFSLQVIDADRIGHDLLQDADVLSELAQAFPSSILNSSGQVVRSKLAELVFGETEEQQAALNQLEQIIHPAIRREIIAQLETVDEGIDAVILDAAILLEAGWASVCDHLVFIDTPKALRLERVSQNRNWSAEELNRREAAQLPLDEKEQQANFTVDNSGTLDEAAAQMTQILQQLIVR